MLNRVKAFTGPRAEERAERCGHFLKGLAGSSASREFCIQHKILLQKASGEDIGAVGGGGFLVPEELDNAILQVRDTVGAFASQAETRPATSVMNVRPRRTQGLTASWTSEGASIPESSFQLDGITAVLKKIAILARSSTELWEDSAADLAEFVANEIAWAFASTEDDSGFNGDGTSTYRGISGLFTKLTGTKSAIAAASAHNTWLTLDSTDIANLMGGILATGIRNARWYISEIGFAQCFCRLSGVSGSVTWITGPDGKLEASYLGFPISFSSKLPNATTSLAGKAMIYFGDLRQSAVLVQRHATVIASSSHRAMDQDQILTRATRREDIICHLGVGGDMGSAYAPIAMLTGTT
jgi:HK97 family phage major capsid protein